VILHRLQRFYTRNHEEHPQKVSFNEAAGEVCTATCRREARLDTYHYQAQYFTRINR
jgi:hypothetical protein